MWGNARRRGLKDAQDHIDLSAHETATKAITMIEQHAENCDRREAERARRDDQFRHEYAADMSEVKEGIKTGFETVHSRISEDRRFTRWIGLALISVLFGGFIWLLTNDKPWEKEREIKLSPETIEQLRK